MSRSERSRRRRRAPDNPPHAAAPLPKVPDKGASDRFEVRCSCGVALRGERIAGETSVFCPGCGTEHALQSVGGAQVAPPPIAAVGVESASAVSFDRVAELLKSAPPPPPADDQPPLHPERLEQKKRLSWLRVKAVVVLLLVLATAYWGWHQRRRQKFLLELQTATSAGEAALAEANFEQAVEHLARADRAARGLHAHDPQGRRAIQLYAEAMAWSKLAVAGIDEFFFARAAAAASDRQQPLIDEFDRQLADRAVIIQTRIVRMAADRDPNSDLAADADQQPEEQNPPTGRSAPSLPVLEWQIVGDGFRVEIAPEDLSALASTAGDPDQEVVFGAVLKSLELDPHESGRWRIRLVPGSCVLMTTPGPFAALNWPDPGQLEQLLTAQRERSLAEPDAVLAGSPAADAHSAEGQP